MELLSKAYVRAVAAQAGCICVEVNPDFGTDLIIRSVIGEDDRYVDGGAILELQLKSTTLAGVRVGQGQISYDLTVRNYQHLRKTEPVVPERLLVLYLMPEDEAEWLVQDRKSLSLLHGCYYLSLRGLSETENQRTVTVSIPEMNLFSVDFLHQLLLTRKMP